jgi:glycosyltransferase involved in cell wall biosynthesis
VTAVAIAIVQTSIPAYRQAFVDAVTAALGDDVTFYAGDEHFGRGVVTELRADDHVRRAGNVFLLGRRLLWQRGVLRGALSAKICVLEINPRVVSSWTILLLRALLRRPTLLWGHAWSRQGPASKTNRLRMLMCRAASGLIVYTRSEREALAARVGDRPVWVAPNAINTSAEMQCAAPSGGCSGFLFSGRLVPEKKPMLALEAFAAACERLPADASLIFVGDGPEQAALRARSERLGVSERVEFAGALFAIDRLSALYARTLAALSPGYVGLSMIQSQGFGVPMIYARDEPHAPEIEAAREGFNAFAVPSDDVGAFARAMISVEGERADLIARRAAISRSCREAYSAEAMAAGFLEAVDAAAAPRRA